MYMYVCYIDRSWCQDRTLAQARKYVANSMGKQYADPVILNMNTMWAESNPRCPLICLLTMGSDPTAQIESLAKQKELTFGAISMGQGQEVHARKLLDQNIVDVIILISSESYVLLLLLLLYCLILIFKCCLQLFFK